MQVIKIAFLLLMNSILVEFGLMEEENMLQKTLATAAGKNFQKEIDHTHYYRVIQTDTDQTKTYYLYSPQSENTNPNYTSNQVIVLISND